MLRVLLMSIAVCLAVQSSHQSAQFYGGSISFDLDDLPNGGVLAKMEIISGWVLGTGPCGPNCSRADVGRSTKPSRQMMETLTNDPIYFGNFTTDFKRGNDVIKPLHDRMLQNYTEVVLAVNEIAMWEQELLKFSFVVEPGVESQDMNFEGKYWRPSFMGQRQLKWHLQARISPNVRNDTKKRNNCPAVFTKPFYSIKLNTTSRIMLPAIDKDNDFIKCVKAKYIEMGDLQTINQPGITVGSVDEGCQVTIEATEANGYKDDYYVAIPVTVRDMNRVPIKFGSMVYNSAQSAICSTSVQLIVHVLANLVTPEFISPTPSANHRFILYVGSNWDAKVFAKSSENSTITEFMVSGRNLEHYQTSEVKDTTNEHVKYIEISWSPEKSDVQSHIVCVTATDENGVDSAEQRCFILEVIDKTFNHSSQIKSDRPYFIDAPSRDELVKCPVDATCVIPVFVVSKRNVTQIVIPESFMDESSIGDISYVLHNGQYVYKALLAFRHTMQGVVDICLQATDDLGMQSEKLCFKPMIKPPDPCGSSPCKNSARCVSRDDATGLFDCHCDVGYYGIYCEKAVDVCVPSPCDHGICYYNAKPYYCYCADDRLVPNDYTGLNCSDKIDDCAGKTCSNHGMCIDGVKSHTCDCFQRYTGNDCETDLCPGSTHPRTCPSAGCVQPCHNSGVCEDGGCICTLGFEGNICENEKGNISRSLTGVSFVKPTLQTGSKIVCSIDGNNMVQNCSFDVFMETESLLPPSLSLSTTESLIQSTSGPVHEQNLIAGVDKLYTSKISIIGHVVDKSQQYLCVKANDTTNPTAVDKLCLELDFQTTGTPLEDESLIRFLEPTPLAESRLKCSLNERCTLFLYTSFNISCEPVLSVTDGVTIFEPYNDGTRACITEVGYTGTSVGNVKMCFRSAESNYEERCFDIMVFEVGKDQCSKTGDAITGPCQNGGLCFPGDNKQVCFCRKGYTGENCEKGPCQESDNKCENGGFCLVNNHVVSCLCKAGFTGNLCDTDISHVNGNTSFDGGVFTLEGSAQTVNCNRNRMCGLYVPVAYNSNEKPTVAMGYISPTLEVDSVQTEQEIAVGRYITSVSFLPKEVGTFLLCVQTLNMDRINKDELCHKVFVTDGVDLVYGFEDRPLFVMPSLQPSVVIECEESTVCHVTYTATPGVGHEHNCLDIQVSSGGIELLHTFTSCDACVDGLGISNNCLIDISFKPSVADVNKQICVDLILKSGNVRGEERCFNVSVLPSGGISAKKGCQLLECRNGGFCDGHDPNKPLCSCMKGYTGTQCETKLGSTHTGICKPSFLEGSVVTEFECVTDNSCKYQFEICSSISPLVTLGYNNPSLNLGTPALKPPTSSGSCQCYSGSVELRPTIASTDAFKFCLQQVLSDGSTGDELCPSVFVSDTRSSGAVDTKKPHFLQPTLPGGSVLLCKLNETCYLDLHYTDGSTFASSLECPKLRESSGHSLNGLHIFPSKHASNECINDISFQHPSTASGGDIFEYCFKVSIPGKQGEQRCFQLKITSNLITSVDSLCKNRVCHGQARCIADFTAYNAKCICPVGFTGSDCSQVVNRTRNLPGVENASVSTTDAPHFDIHHAIPKVIKCEEGYPCKIEIAFMGETTKIPVLGYCDRNLTGHVQGSVVSLSGQEHLLVSTVTGKAGTYKCCYQTTTTGTDIGENIDEICFYVEIKTQGTVPTSDQNKPRFISPVTNSSFTCAVNSVCHVTMLTEKVGSTCTQVKECGQGLAGVHMFTTEERGGQCITDVGFKTSDQEETNILCAKAGPNGEERQIILEVKNSSGFGPCQKLHCKNGGTCVSMTDAAVCLCRNGFTDTECQLEINECDPVPCVHGSCIDLVNGYSCTCDPGYEGFNCTEEIDECLTNPCIHGTCGDLVNGYTCACETGYEGSNCEIDVDDCVAVVCQHGGTCDDGVDTYRCWCTGGWEGTHCETDMNECSSNPCINNGNCTDEIDGYSCVCNKQFTGMHCELERGGRIHQVTTPNNPQPPSFTEYTIPEIIRCRVNASCTIVLPVDGELNKPPNVQNGHYSPGLIVSPPKTTESNPARCVNGRCAFDARISVVATFVSFFKYCVQTTDYQNVNADELCYQIESYIPSTTPGESSFIQPPTIPNNSTMKCPVGKPCVYIVEIKRPPGGCKDKLTPEGSPPNTMVHLVPFGNSPTCKYEVVFTPEPLQQESHVLLCFRTYDFDRHCSKVHVQRENEIAQSTGGCSQLHCVNGGFCDSSSRPSCQCQPGFMGDTCAKPDEKCVVGSIPDQVVCNQQSCSLEFLVTGSITVPVVVETEQHLLPEIFPDSFDIGTYYVSLKVTGAVASGSRVCIKTESNGKSGNCSSTDCTTIAKDGSVTTIQSVLNCTETDSAGKCLPIVMTTCPFSNKTCPQLSVHQDTTLASVHVFENKLVDSHDPRCVAIVTAFPSGGSSNKERLCLTDSLSGVRCMTTVTSYQKKCDSRKATARARNSVSSGLVSCFCEVHGQKLPVIITRPQIKTERLMKVAGFGAGGMAGAMIVGVLIYLIISGVKGDRKIDSYGRPMPVGKPLPCPRPNSMNSLIDAKARLKARRIYPNSVDSF